MSNQEEIIITEHNVSTGEVVDRPATQEEKTMMILAENEKQEKELTLAKEEEERQKEQEEKNAEKQLLLEKIGLTKEEFDLLIQ